MCGELRSGIHDGMEYGADRRIRFHAWQSSLLFTAIFVLHLIFSWSTFLSWLIFVGDLGLIGWLTWRAYTDGEFSFLDYWFEILGESANEWIADTLDRCEVPFFGRLASSILDDE